MLIPSEHSPATPYSTESVASRARTRSKGAGRSAGMRSPNGASADRPLGTPDDARAAFWPMPLGSNQCWRRAWPHCSSGRPCWASRGCHPAFRFPGVGWPRKRKDLRRPRPRQPMLLLVSYASPLARTEIREIPARIARLKDLGKHKSRPARARGGRSRRLTTAGFRNRHAGHHLKSNLDAASKWLSTDGNASTQTRALIFREALTEQLLPNGFIGPYLSK
jgi:hypothetical protein